MGFQHRSVNNMKKPNKQEITQGFLANMASELLTRQSYMAQLGQSFNGNRDIYTALGYPKSLTYDDYFLRYDRQDIATRIIEAPVTGCWSKLPQILETEEKQDTQFEQAFIALNTSTRLLSKIVQLDKLCGIGEYAVLFLGFAGATTEQLKDPVSGNPQLLYVTPFGQGNAEIMSYEEDTQNPRYGKPKTYRLTMNLSTTKTTTTTRQIMVHHSRCLHIAENCLDSDVFGTPRLKKVFNRLMDLDKIVGGSGEMFWQGAFPGMAFKADSDSDMTQSAAAVTTEIDNYVHQLKRHMRLQGIDVQQLNGQAIDPTAHVDIQVQMISAATGIPKRILLGSERGELSSSQDADNWADHLQQRREEFCEGAILRPLIDLLIQNKSLPTPGKDGYKIDWPPLYIQNDKEKAEVASKRAEALGKYTSGSLDMLMSFDAFLEHVCEYDRDVVDLIIASGEGLDLDTGQDELLDEELPEVDTNEEDIV